MRIAVSSERQPAKEIEANIADLWVLTADARIDVDVLPDWWLVNGESGTALALRRTGYSEPRVLLCSERALLVDPGEEQGLLLLAVRFGETEANCGAPLSSMPELQSYHGLLSQRSVLLFTDLHKARTQLSLTELRTLHSACHQHEAAADIPSDIFLPADWQLEEVTCRRHEHHALLIVDCEPPDSTQPMPQCTDDVEIAIVTETATTFRLQSPAEGWRHGPDAALDLVVFEQALCSPGVHSIFVCACGVSGCHCYPSRNRGVLVRLLANGQTVWHDRDRDLWYRFPSEHLHAQLRDLKPRAKAVQQEFSAEGQPSFPLEPYRSADSLGLAPVEPWESELSKFSDNTEQPVFSESARAALAYLPELADSGLAYEIREFTRWIDEERLEPLGTLFVPFAEGLLKIFPQILGLPRLERIVLVLAAAAHHEEMGEDEAGELLLGYPRLRALLGDIDTLWQPLLNIRNGEMPSLRNLPQDLVRWDLLAALLRFGEFLMVAEHRPSCPMPREMFGPFEELVETDDPQERYRLRVRPFDQAAWMEFWRRAYTDRVDATQDGGIQLVFQVPASVADLYVKHLILPRVQELIALLETIQQGFTQNGLHLGPLSYQVESVENLPRMPEADERLFVPT